MRGFFKIFFASLLALLVFSLLLFFILVGVVGSLASRDEAKVEAKSVLTLDLSKRFSEHASAGPLDLLAGEQNPTLYEVVRLINNAREDENISGIYLLLDGNSNGYAASNELRTALLHFKTSRKFVLAFGNTVSENSYFVGNVADKIYVNPVGSVEWDGFNITIPFIKGLLDKTDIKMQVFYAGKFKSATEIFRTTEMTPENRLQTREWLGDIYSYFLQQTAAARRVDTATLYRLAATAAIQTPQDAVNARLIDAAAYDDEVRADIKRRLKIGRTDPLHLVSINTYKDAVNVRKGGRNKIAVIYAEGDIVDGPGDDTQIGGENFRALIRKARLDKDVKAIVLRVNTGGGSALASDIIWRELKVARTVDKKPVVVSMGDVAASGGYYIASGADSIYAHPNTITGSIGVFGVIPNMQDFFNDKLGITFDGVSTAPYADVPTVVRPLNEKEANLVRNGVERIYEQFKQRVAAGRNLDTAYVEGIAQGRVWSGKEALRLRLVDKLGTLQEAIACAARMAKLSEYGLKEYPESESWLQTIFNRKKEEPTAILKQQMGEDAHRVYEQVKKLQNMSGSVQARLPFEIIIH